MPGKPRGVIVWNFVNITKSACLQEAMMTIHIGDKETWISCEYGQFSEI